MKPRNKHEKLYLLAWRISHWNDSKMDQEIDLLKCIHHWANKTVKTQQVSTNCPSSLKNKYNSAWTAAHCPSPQVTATNERDSTDRTGLRQPPKTRMCLKGWLLVLCRSQSLPRGKYPMSTKLRGEVDFSAWLNRFTECWTRTDLSNLVQLVEQNCSTWQWRR